MYEPAKLWVQVMADVYSAPSHFENTDDLLWNEPSVTFFLGNIRTYFIKRNNIKIVTFIMVASLFRPECTDGLMALFETGKWYDE